MSNTSITCPSCNYQFELTDAVREEVQRDMHARMMEWQKKKDDEFRQKEEQMSRQIKDQQEMFRKQAEEERRKAVTQAEEQIYKQVSGDFETRLKMLQQVNEENEERLKQARQQELDFLKKEQELKNKEAELEIQLQRKVQEERERLTEDIRKMEQQKTEARETEFLLRMKELEKQLEDQKKLADEMRRKAEQGSMQLQGEVQELELENLLRSTFPFDMIQEVGKGARGADCMQTVRNNLGQECGRIIYESKRTKDFNQEWIEKLKADMRQSGADIAVIVTQVKPRDMKDFGERDGVWICNFQEVRPVAHILRDALIRIYMATKNQENKGDKMSLLYNYLTGSEFSGQWRAIREGFMSMQISIQKERDAMERLWKSREKQLEKILLSAAHIRGSIDGISGLESIDLNLLEDPALIADTCKLGINYRNSLQYFPIHPGDIVILPSGYIMLL